MAIRVWPSGKLLSDLDAGTEVVDLPVADGGTGASDIPTVQETFNILPEDVIFFQSIAF